GEAESREAVAQIEIEELGEQLTQALAHRVSELQRVRSDFLAKMQDVLGGRENIRQVGDRFVLQSELLFDTASAELGAAGLPQLAVIAEVVRSVAEAAPPDLDWMLRVDGHTDQRPITGSRWRDNWELSLARAAAVVRYLVEEEGIDPRRLAAAGFGPYRPIAEGTSEEALARNRRIEFKFTER